MTYDIFNVQIKIPNRRSVRPTGTDVAFICFSRTKHIST